MTRLHTNFLGFRVEVERTRVTVEEGWGARVQLDVNSSACRTYSNSMMDVIVAENAHGTKHRVYLFCRSSVMQRPKSRRGAQSCPPFLFHFEHFLEMKTLARLGMDEDQTSPPVLRTSRLPASRLPPYVPSELCSRGFSRARFQLASCAR